MGAAGRPPPLLGAALEPFERRGSSTTIHWVNARTKQLLDEVLALPASDRALIASELEESLDDEGISSEELARRLDDVASGRVDLLDADVVIAELRAKFTRR